MRRSIVSIMILVSALLAGASAQVMVTPQGWATTPGPALGVYAPLMVTPVAHLETPQGAIGAAASAPGQQVGATSFSTGRVFTPTPPTIVPRVVNAPPSVYAAVPQPGPGSQATASAAATQPQQQQSAAIDLGIAPIEGAGYFSGGPSLAQEVSAERRGSQKQAVRTLTNQDVDRMNEQTKSGTLGLPAKQ